MNVELEEQIRDWLVNDLFVDVPREQIGMDDNLRTTVGLDSVCFLELRVLCERRLGVSIPDADFSPEHFSTIRGLASLIRRLGVPSTA
jgi:acyl carrier protein